MHIAATGIDAHMRKLHKVLRNSNIILERFLDHDLDDEDTAKDVRAHVSARRKYLLELAEKGKTELASGAAMPLPLPAGGGDGAQMGISVQTAQPMGAPRAATPLPTSQAAHGSSAESDSRSADAQVLANVLTCLARLDQVTANLHSVLKSSPDSVNPTNETQVGAFVTRYSSHDQVTRSTYAGQCLWAFTLWPVVLAATQPERQYPGTVRFGAKQDLQSSLHVGSSSASGAQSTPPAEPAKPAKNLDGVVIVDLFATYPYKLMIQANKSEVIPAIKRDFVKCCQEVANSIAIDSCNFNLTTTWSPAAAGQGQHHGMRDSPYPPKYIYQVMGVELHVFALEALASDLYIVYQVAATRLDSHRISVETQKLLPSVGVIEPNHHDLLFIPYAILSQFHAWYRATGPSFVEGQGNVRAIGIPATQQELGPDASNSSSGWSDNDEELPQGAGEKKGAQTYLEPFGGADRQTLESRYMLGDVVWNQPHSVVWRGVRVADNQPVVVKRCLLEAALATVRTGCLLRTGSETTATSRDDDAGVQQMRSAKISPSLERKQQTVVACDARRAYVVAPVLEFFYDQLSEEDKSPRMATLVFPRLSEVCAPSEASLRRNNDAPIAVEALAWFWDFAIQFADRVSHLHSLQLSHGDLKPMNVMLDPANGRVCLIDLDHSQYPLHSGWLRNMHGTDVWKAPELVRSNRCRSEAADRWGLGAVLFHALRAAMNVVQFDGLVESSYDDMDVADTCDELQRLYDGAEWVDRLRAALQGCFGARLDGQRRSSATRMRDELQTAFETYLGTLVFFGWLHRWFLNYMILMSQVETMYLPVVRVIFVY